ncbi:hybrid sensor histidine kinase/response regulator [Desulfospira joergensenii]|uniref:hybrid sensor histidine kinase/response regulator n=1 Tax=Desulfospira joergensenii TaxID=53329 RepID=UPI0003B6805E|nr:ATP-binding protein [Desulfospira joergensenii]
MQAKKQAGPVLFFWILFAYIGFISGQGPARAEEFHEPRHLLLLNSYNQRMSWVKDIVLAVEDVLDPDNNNILLHIDNMDAKQFHGPDYFEAYKSYLRVKYGNSRFSLVLSSDNHAFDFLLKYREELFPGVPVVFCGVNDFRPDLIKGVNKFTGVAEVFSARKTVELALALHPGTEEIFIINDFLETGRAWQRDIDTALEGLKKRTRITYSENLPIRELMEKITHLDDHALVLLGVYFADRDGRYFTYEKIGEMIAGASRVPVYCLLEFNMGKGVVGGEVISGYHQGEAMAGMAQKILAGEDPEKIPVLQKGANQIIFDFTQLKRFGLNPSRLPPEALIINQPFSLFQEYKKEILVVAVLMAVLISTIGILIVNIFRRIRAEKQVRKNEEKYRRIFENSVVGFFQSSPGGKLISVNPAFAGMLGYDSPEDMIASIADLETDLYLKVEDRQTYQEILQREGRVDGFEYPVKCKDGSAIWLSNSTRAYFDDKGKPVTYEGVVKDITGIKLAQKEKAEAEQKLMQARKMEAIGTLSGGVAHEFNNLLGIILGNAELAADDTPEENPVRPYLSEIGKACLRGKKIVGQLLSFVRNPRTSQKPIDIGKVTAESFHFLKASLPPSIECRMNLPEKSMAILGDSTEIHQVIINLCNNAAHSMEGRAGILSLTLEERFLEKTESFYDQELEPGRYGVIKVADTGEGIEPHRLDKIFDPFYTTKEVDKGSGLGLSVVLGIIKGHRGGIRIMSRPGHGTEVECCFPLIEERVSESRAEKAELRGGNERILFVDDEAAVVTIGKTSLERVGYTVFTQTDPLMAVEAVRKDPQGFDLVITDLSMPGMNGQSLISMVNKIRPDLKTIVCTGFHDRLEAVGKENLGANALLMKPIRQEDLRKSVRMVLDGKGR